MYKANIFTQYICTFAVSVILKFHGEDGTEKKNRLLRDMIMKNRWNS